MTGLENLEAGGGEFYFNADGELFAADPVTNALTPVSELPAPTPSDGWETAHDTAPKILAAAITIHWVVMTPLNGIGAPDTGAGLTADAEVLRGASAIVGSAGSDPGWQGPAAKSYDDRNSEQQDRITQMVELDTELAGLLQTQAAEVEELRDNMYGVGGTLLAAIPIAWGLYQIAPPVGPRLSTVYQIATATACLAADISLQTKQGLRSQETGAAIEKVAASYAEIATAAQASRPLHTPGRET